MMESVGMLQLIDAVIAFTLLEGLLLVAFHRRSGKGVPPRDFIGNMASGLCLMLALHGLASGAGVLWVALSLLAAGVAHGVDMAMRWKRADRSAERSADKLGDQRADNERRAGAQVSSHSV